MKEATKVSFLASAQRLEKAIFFVLSRNKQTKMLNKGKDSSLSLDLLEISAKGVEHGGDLERDVYPKTQVGSFKQSSWERHGLRRVF